jgi:hypothetical protein
VLPLAAAEEWSGESVAQEAEAARDETRPKADQERQQGDAATDVGPLMRVKRSDRSLGLCGPFPTFFRSFQCSTDRPIVLSGVVGAPKAHKPGETVGEIE